MNAQVLFLYTLGDCIGVKSYFHLAEQSQQDQVSAHCKGLIPRVKRHPCQTISAISGGPVRTCQVICQCILVHAVYSSNPDPQHHARVWMRF